MLAIVISDTLKCQGEVKTCDPTSLPHGLSKREEAESEFVIRDEEEELAEVMDSEGVEG